MDTLKTAHQEPIALPPHQKRYLTEHATCPMCETELKIDHKIDRNGCKVKEVAHCPQCDVCTRSVEHELH